LLQAEAEAEADLTRQPWVAVVEQAELKLIQDNHCQLLVLALALAVVALVLLEEPTQQVASIQHSKH
jgi:hypothetical protein